MYVKIGKKYQVTLPKDLRADAKILIGETLFGTLDQNNGAMTLSRNKPDDAANVHRICVRDRYQMTLPAKVFRTRGVKEGDVVEIRHNGSSELVVYLTVAVATPDTVPWSRRATIPADFPSALGKLFGRRRRSYGS